MSNKYFNSAKFKKGFDDLKKLTDMEIELLLTDTPGDKLVRVNNIYRPIDQEFKQNQDMIFAGCSQTHGDHICPPLAINGSHEQIWGFLVAKELNLDSINLGVGADSIYRIVQRLIAHFKVYGNPKMLLCLFPDPYRFFSPIDKDNLIGKRPYGTFSFLEATFHGDRDVNELPKFSKKPYNKEDVIPKIIPIFFNIQSIHMIEQYCKSSGIKFLWGSWDKDTNIIVKQVKVNDTNVFNNFIDLDEDAIDWNTIDCHKQIYDKYPSLYSMGIDNQHMGMHRHAHIAEKLIKEIQKL